MKISFKILAHIVAFSWSMSVFAQLPYLEKKESSPKLIVDGKPFLILGGELHNSTASDKEAMGSVMKRMKELNLNTVLTYAYWEFIEPTEGTFNFELIDTAVEEARKADLKLIILWFGSWKSTASTYVPEWVKTNPKRFSRYTLADGSTREILSPFSEENMKADAKAYSALMKHINEVDKDHAVIMTQVENEPGCFEGYRDYSPEAINAWKSAVPSGMIDYLTSHKGKLFSALEKAWSENGYKTTGTWEDVFGKSSNESEYKYYTEELFMAFYYSRYIEYVAAQGRKELSIPAFCNAWMYNKRGFYPHGTCNPHVLDAYRAAGKALDFYSPNTYTTDYDDLFQQFVLGGNTLFVPESVLVPAGALYSIGAYNSLGFSPFGIDGESTLNPSSKTDLKIFIDTYAALSQMMGTITSNYNSGKMKGVYVNAKKTEQQVEIGDYILTAMPSGAGGFGLDFGKSIEQIGKSHLSPTALMLDTPAPTTTAPAQVPVQPTPPAPSPVPAAALPGTGKPIMGAAIVIQTAPDEFIVVGYGTKFHFELKPDIKFQHLGFASIDEGTFENDRFIARKRWNGDEQKASLPDSQLTILRIKLYHF